MKLNGARISAWRILDEVQRGVPFEASCERNLSTVGDPRDRTLAAELVRGALTWQARYDYLIDYFARKPGRIKPRVRLVLRLGFHQLLALDRVPDHAVVHEAVALVREVAGTGATGFVNGMLRTVIRAVADHPAQGPEAFKSLFPDPRCEPVAHLAAWYSHPAWLVEKWLSRFGREPTERLLQHDNTPPPVDLHVLDGYDPELVAADLVASGTACDLLPGGLGLRLSARLSRDDLSRLLGEHPFLIVQDASVQEATRWLATGSVDPCLDLCAAPGGKTIHLRALLPDSLSLVAVDNSPPRLQRLGENLKRTAPGPVAVLCADGLSAPFRDGVFGTVLLDGPCSGTGVIRHHCEGRWRLRPSSLQANRKRLSALAHEALRVLAPGGRLLYATCSLEPEENEHVVEELLATHGGLVPDPSCESAAGRAWLPWREGGDGFFAARLQKNG